MWCWLKWFASKPRPVNCRLFIQAEADLLVTCNILNEGSAFTSGGEEGDRRPGDEQRNATDDAHRVWNFAHVCIGDHYCRGRLKKHRTVEDNATDRCQENAYDY